MKVTQDVVKNKIKEKKRKENCMIYFIKRILI
jgi:hypothetical protein